jgi:hypothetical protein
MNVLDDLGYITEQINPALQDIILKEMSALAWWILPNKEIKLTAEKTWQATRAIQNPRGESFRALASLRLPPEALLIRRMEGLCLQTAIALEAQANWGLLMDEIVGDGGPYNNLGKDHKQWLDAKSE